ncbi:5-formyltetrahydrofolate cyclo-ligase [Arthrobacter sp. ISL-30]|uniref:5-formyltetrahydrofolate cyclo-ligase n=1 Tax=Arthrobacter sp. ISL-30 TaxID=2819109 RepID=UPI001BE9E5CF|nr:5-formyltetrahydrofolate cyclo-ligase [Arthrobacter sp. ISL-30]MBT2514313.1 5-formyltetrahydrofolate cyclo-ligase [Arthrobacter sp. ISL-30]
MQSKELIRAEHRARRKSLTDEQIARAGKALARHGVEWASEFADAPGSAFAVYLGTGSEPPTLPLITALYDSGYRVLLPVCEPERRLSWVYWTPSTPLVRSRYAPIDEPDGEKLPQFPADEVAGIFLPATAVSLDGSRIGQGGGYYDRLLASLDSEGRRPPAVALVYDAEVLEAGAIPAEPFDRPVASALTPSGLVLLNQT